MKTDFRKRNKLKHLWLPVVLSVVIILCCALAWLNPSGTYANVNQTAVNQAPKLSIDVNNLDEGYMAVLYNNMNGLPTSEANAIVTTKEGFVWIGCYSGLIRYDGISFERINHQALTSVTELFVDSKDRLWIGTNDSGVTCLEDGQYITYNKANGIPSLSVKTITEDKDGTIYLGTTAGVAYIDSDSSNVITIDAPELEHVYMRELRTGYDGTVYGITHDSNVFTLKKGELTSYYTSEELGLKEARSIISDQTDFHKVYIADGNSNIVYGDMTDGEDFAEVKYSCSDCGFINDMMLIDGHLWVCGDDGIGVLQDGRIRKIDNLPMTSSIERIMVDYQGNPWFASSQQGVMKLVPDRFTDIYFKYGLDPDVVYSTCMYNDMLFIGSKNNGLYILKDGEKLDTFPITSAKTASGVVLEDNDLIALLKSESIRSIVTDSQNRLWISTRGDNGLIRYYDGEIIKFTMDDGMPSDKCRTVIELDDGSFMAVCTDGLVIINSQDEISKIYDDGYGIQNIEFMTAVQAENGAIIAGTDGGGIYIIENDEVTAHLTVDNGLTSEVILRLKKDRTRDLYWIVTSNSISYLDENFDVHLVENFPYANNFDLFQNSDDEMWVLSSNGVYIADTSFMILNSSFDTSFYGVSNGLHNICTANSYSCLTDDGVLYIAGTSGVSKVNIDEEPAEDKTLNASVSYVDADGTIIYPDADGCFNIPSNTKKLTIYPHVFSYSLMTPSVSYYLEGFEMQATTIDSSYLAPIIYTNLEGKTYYFHMDVKDSLTGANVSVKVKIVKEKQLTETIGFNIAAIILAGLLMTLITALFFRRRTAKLVRKNEENRSLIRGIVEAFAKVVDMKDAYTKGHSNRVAEYTAILAKELGYDEDTIWKFYNIALMHDIGKVGVPEEVLNKPGRLNDEEYEIIKSHTVQGYDILKNITIMPELAVGAEFHHERPDGKGYPKGLKEGEIPRVAQIIAVADTFDAMYSDRPYRHRMNFDKVVSIIKDCRGTQLTADVVDAFLRLVERGYFRDPNDKGGGATEDITNIRNGKAQDK